LTSIDSHSQYSVDAHPASCDVDKDVCEPVRFGNPRKNSAICILRSVHPRMHELFALRLLLRRFPARTLEDLRRRNGEVHQTFHEAARQLGLVWTRDPVAEICLQDVIDIHRPPSDIRVLLAQMVYYGASREPVGTRFCDHASISSEKCLICGTTGIAAVQYPGGKTFRPLFRLGIDEQSGVDFRSNIGRGSPLVWYIFAADLIIIDEVSMLAPWVANRISMTLQSISGHERIEFGGKRILFVGDLLQ
jgi:hypothetical protein